MRRKLLISIFFLFLSGGFVATSASAQDGIMSGILLGTESGGGMDLGTTTASGFLTDFLEGLDIEYVDQVDETIELLIDDLFLGATSPIGGRGERYVFEIESSPGSGVFGNTADVRLFWNISTGRVESEEFRVRVVFTGSGFPSSVYRLTLATDTTGFIICSSNFNNGLAGTPLPPGLLSTTPTPIGLVGAACPEAGGQLQDLILLYSINGWAIDQTLPCTDTDVDGVCDDEDNCMLVSNPDQHDANAGEDDDSSLPGVQHYGNACDGDFNEDGVIGFPDFGAWLFCFNLGKVGMGGGPSEDPDCTESDMNGDNLMGIDDFNAFATSFREGKPGPGCEAAQFGCNN